MAAQSKNVIVISPKTIFLILAVVLSAAFLYFIRDILLLAFISLVLASAIAPWVDWLQKWKIPRSLGTMFIYVCAIGAIFFSILLLIVPIKTEIVNLSDDFPRYWQELSFGWQAVEQFSESHGLKQSIADTIATVETSISAMATNIFGGALSFIGGAFDILVVMVITFYLVVYDKQMKRKIALMLPEKYQSYSTHLINRMQEKIGLWLRGQLVLSIIIFLVSLIGLLLLGVKYAWVLALLAGVMEIVPYFGPIISAIPAVFIGFTQSPILGLLTLLLFIIIQQAENYLLTPQVMRKAVGLNPVIVIVAMLVGAKVAGIAGIIIAVPVTTALSVVIDDVIKHRKSGFAALSKGIDG